jgi:DNA-binding CsgD family transcriptional regulator
MAGEDNSELPLPLALWTQLIEMLHLPPQQIRIVELILRNRGDKEIAAALGIKVPTVRTYLHRIYERMGVGDRQELVLKLFGLSHRLNPPQR